MICFFKYNYVELYRIVVVKNELQQLGKYFSNAKYQ